MGMVSHGKASAARQCSVSTSFHKSPAGELTALLILMLCTCTVCVAINDIHKQVNKPNDIRTLIL